MSLSIRFVDTKSCATELASKLGWRIQSAGQGDEYYLAALKWCIHKICEVNKVPLFVISEVPISEVPDILKMYSVRLTYSNLLPGTNRQTFEEAHMFTMQQYEVALKRLSQL